MAKNHFTARDYYTAAFERLQESEQLRQSKDTVILAGYTAGVSIECMLRAYGVINLAPFDKKHDLRDWLTDSGLLNSHNMADKEAITKAVNTANRLWANDLRYYSRIRLKRTIGHEMARVKEKDHSKYFAERNKELYQATSLIIEKGKAKWESQKG